MGKQALQEEDEIKMTIDKLQNERTTQLLEAEAIKSELVSVRQDGADTRSKLILSCYLNDGSHFDNGVDLNDNRRDVIRFIAEISVELNGAIWSCIELTQEQGDNNGTLKGCAKRCGG